MPDEVDDTLWDAIEQSPLFGVYVSELYWLAADVVRVAEGLFESTVVGPDDGTDFIGVDAELHGQLYVLLGDAAKIRALIQDRTKRRDQSAVAYALQKRRTAALRSLLGSLELTTTLSAHVRHSLQHFDERLDRAAVQIADGTAPLPLHVPFNMVISRRRALLTLRGTNSPSPKLFPLRVFIADERIFMNAGDEIDVGSLCAECREIKTRLQPLVAEKPDEARGAGVVVLTPGSFPRRESN